VQRVDVTSIPFGLVQIILASSSPRRRQLLEQLGWAFDVRAADIDETPRSNEAAPPYVERLAREKSFAVECPLDTIVIAADTIVTIDGELLGKPVNDIRAHEMLRQLSGRRHEVMTGVALRSIKAITSFVETTVVHFAELTDEEIAWYVRTGEPADKAGAYAMQGRGGVFVTSIDGSYDNVIGLPRYRLVEAMRARGVDLVLGRLDE